MGKDDWTPRAGTIQDDDGWSAPPRDDDWDDGAEGFAGGGGLSQPTKAQNSGRVHRLREDFWRAMDIHHLSIPRWQSIPKATANIKWMLDGGPGRPPTPEHVVRTSFEYFRGEVERYPVGPNLALWDCFFRNRQRYLDMAVAAQAGAREEGEIYSAGDLVAGQQAPVVKRRRIIRHD